jgi:hypothetical protein
MEDNAIFKGNVDNQIPSHDTPHVHSRGIVHSCFARAEWWLDGFNLKICFVSSYCVVSALPGWNGVPCGRVTYAQVPSENHL